jgi:hypothetical protein
MGMDSSGTIRELTASAPLRSDEVPLTQKQATEYGRLPRKERRRLFREQAKLHRKAMKQSERR